MSGLSALSSLTAQPGAGPRSPGLARKVPTGVDWRAPLRPGRGGRSRERPCERAHGAGREAKPERPPGPFMS